MKYPISVIVPLSDSRRTLFSINGLPSIKRNRPAEIIVDDETGNANVKRNNAVRSSTQALLFPCDDDVILERYALQRLMDALVRDRGASYAYCDFVAVNHPTRTNALIKPGPFTADRLRKQNYISTMSLVRRQAFKAVGGFDEKIERYQDWDLWLSMLGRGMTGTYVPEVLFVALYVDDGITKGIEGAEDAMRIVKQKHGIA